MNLKDEIVAGESYSLEFKRVPNEEREKYLKTVVAFANGKGGRILFGVANDRTVVGIPNERIFTEMDCIVNSISDACAPKIPVDLGVENIDGKAVILSTTRRYSWRFTTIAWRSPLPADFRVGRRRIAPWPVTQRFVMTFSPRPSTICAISRNGAVVSGA